MNLLTVPFREGGGPLYRQLYRYLADEIAAGRIPAGERLPSKRALMANLGVSQSTVESAYDRLLTEGYIRSVPKSGYYACRLEHLAPDAPQERPAPPEEPELPAFRCDLSTSAVDPALFPYATWARLSRETLYRRPELLSPGHRQGDPELRAALAQYLHEFRGVRCEATQIVIGAGIEYLIGLIAQLLGGAVFALEDPGYRRLLRVLENHGRGVRFIPLDGAGMQIAPLEESGAQAAYVTPSHQFPLGVTMAAPRRTALLAWAGRGPGRFVIEDDFDSEYRYNGRPIPALQGLDRNGRVIYLSSFSKSLAPSIRIAYMVLPPELLDAYRRKFGAYSCTVSRFEQHTLARFLQDGHFARHINRTRLVYRRRRDALTGGLRAAGLPVEVLGGDAGVHLVLRVKNGMEEAELVARAAEQGVRVTGLSQYALGGAAPYRDAVAAGYAGPGGAQAALAAELLAKAWGPGGA